MTARCSSDQIARSSLRRRPNRECHKCGSPLCRGQTGRLLPKDSRAAAASRVGCVWRPQQPKPARFEPNKTPKPKPPFFRAMSPQRRSAAGKRAACSADAPQSRCVVVVTLGAAVRILGPSARSLHPPSRPRNWSAFGRSSRAQPLFITRYRAAHSTRQSRRLRALRARVAHRCR